MTPPTQLPLPAGRRRFWFMQVVYLLVSSLLVLLIINAPRNRNWLNTSVSRFYAQRQTLGQRTDLANRQRVGYGDAYTYTTLIRRTCKPTDYFLIPPQRYLIRKAYQVGKATGYAWIYPSVLYYHLGKSVRLLDMTAPDSVLNRATYTFQAQTNRLVLVRLTAQNRTVILTEFGQYDPLFFAYTPDQAKAYYQSTP